MMFSSTLLCGLMLSWFYLRVTGLTEQLSVIQSPSNITVNEEDSAEITCCWYKNTHPVKVRWYKNVRGASTDNQLHQTSTKTNCSTLKIINVTKNDEGDYVCKVTQDIPFLIEGTGNKTTLTVIQILTTTEENTSTAPYTSTVVPVTTNVPTTKKLHKVENPKINLDDRIFHSLDSPRINGSSWKAVIIFIFRCLPFLCLLGAFFYLDRDDKNVTKILKPAVQCDVVSGDTPEENLEAGSKERNENQDEKQAEVTPEEEKETKNTEKPTTGEGPEEVKDDQEKDSVLVRDTEKETVPTPDSKEGTVPVSNTGEKTLLMSDDEKAADFVLADSIISAP